MKAIISLVVLGGGALSFYSLRLRHRTRLTSDLEREMESLNEENAQERSAYEARLAELEERVDFVERRLAQGREEPRRIERPLSTPV
ncbi:MAG TPA: hypothetical protein VGI92_05670 [Gemmatimonadales bacterium]